MKENVIETDGLRLNIREEDLISGTRPAEKPLDRSSLRKTCSQ
jgi:hypothetical protein